MSTAERGRLVPVLGWLPSYRRADARYDLIAGISVSALVVPKSLGYAGIAQVPVEAGLYAAAAATLLYAVFGTSRQISTGPSSSLAAIAASAIALTGVPAGDQTAALVVAITLTIGAVFVVAATLRMGWLSRLLSKAVITGFLFGAAIDVVIGELPKLTGTDADGTNSWRELGSWLRGLGDVEWTTVVVGAIALAVVFALRVTAPKIPGALVLVVGGIAGSRMLDLAARGVATVGDVPRGLPAPELPSIDLFQDHMATILTAAIAAFLIGFSQTAGDARVFASRHHYRIRLDQELVAQGMCNVGAGVFQGMPVTTSLSASSLNDSSGARTPMASVVTGAIVVLTLLFLAPVFSDLPAPVLAVIIIDAVVFGMMDVAEMRRLRRVKRIDFWIAILAIVGVLTAGVLAGVVIGILLSVGWLVYVSATPAMTELGREPGSSAFRSLDDNPGDETHPGMLVVRFDGGLTFVTADPLGNGIEQRLRDAAEPITAIVIDFAGVNFIDSQGTFEIGRLAQLAERDGFSLRLTRVRSDVLDTLGADGVLARLGDDHVHSNVDQAVRTELEGRLGSRD